MSARTPFALMVIFVLSGCICRGGVGATSTWHDPDLPADLPSDGKTGRYIVATYHRPEPSKTTVGFTAGDYTFTLTVSEIGDVRLGVEGYKEADWSFVAGELQKMYQDLGWQHYDLVKLPDHWGHSGC